MERTVTKEEEMEEGKGNGEGVDLRELEQRKREMEKLSGLEEVDVVVEDIYAYRGFNFKSPSKGRMAENVVILCDDVDEDPEELFHQWKKGEMDSERYARDVKSVRTVTGWGEVSSMHSRYEWKCGEVWYLAADIKLPGGDVVKRVPVGKPGPRWKIEKLHERVNESERLQYNGRTLIPKRELPDKPSMTELGMAGIAGLASVAFIALTFGPGGIVLYMMMLAVAAFENMKRRQPDYIQTSEHRLYGKEFAEVDINAFTEDPVQFVTIDVVGEDDGTIQVEAEDGTTWTYPGKDGIPHKDAEWVFDDHEALDYGMTGAAVRPARLEDETNPMVSDCGEWVILPEEG